MKKFLLILSIAFSFAQGQAQPNCEEKIPAGLVNPDNNPFRLLQNFPNPARQSTSIKFHVNCPGIFSLALYDMLGNPLTSIYEGEMQTGDYTMPVTVEDLEEGIYFYVLKKGRFSQTMKLIVSKDK
jgi:hypothetical protein